MTYASQDRSGIAKNRKKQGGEDAQGAWVKARAEAHGAWHGNERLRQEKKSDG